MMRKKKEQESPVDSDSDAVDLNAKHGDESEAKSEKGKGRGKGRHKAKPSKHEEVEDDRLLRLQADFENFRKRVARERGELHRRANEDIILELLPVLDHMDLALESVSEHQQDDAFVEGVRLVSGQLSRVLQKFGLQPIDAKGKDFDPHLHEAVSHLPSPDAEENTVIEQTRRGYLLADRVLRAAQVVVSSGPANTTAGS